MDSKTQKIIFACFVVQALILVLVFFLLLTSHDQQNEPASLFLLGIVMGIAIASAARHYRED